MFHFKDKILLIEFLTAVVKFRRYAAIALIAAVTTVCLSSCHTSRRASTRPGHPDVADVHVGKASKLQKEIIDEACSWLGTPYKYAGVEKGEGADCSGMVMKVYETITGEKIPRNSAKQAEYCTRLDASDVNTGDLIFFATGKDPDRVSHVGIVIDNESFIHASSSKGVVISKFTTPYYQRTFIMFGRCASCQESRYRGTLTHFFANMFGDYLFLYYICQLNIGTTSVFKRRMAITYHKLKQYNPINQKNNEQTVCCRN